MYNLFWGWNWMFNWIVPYWYLIACPHFEIHSWDPQKKLILSPPTPYLPPSAKMNNRSIVYRTHRHVTNFRTPFTSYHVYIINVWSLKTKKKFFLIYLSTLVQMKLNYWHMQKCTTNLLFKNNRIPKHVGAFKTPPLYPPAMWTS